MSAMTETELRARRVMYGELAMSLRRARQTNAKHEVRRWEEHASRVQRSIDLLNSGHLRMEPEPFIIEGLVVDTEDTWDEADDDWDKDRPRCEADHKDGGVCQRLLTPSGHCPGVADHA